ncbi:MAG TPA: hypothetical protein VN303_14245 [Pseudomonas sp.]|nr:hypothetical protein [Pseudomonas sp.]
MGLDRGQARSYSQCAALKVFNNSCRINSNGGLSLRAEAALRNQAGATSLQIFAT